MTCGQSVYKTAHDDPGQAPGEETMTKLFAFGLLFAWALAATAVAAADPVLPKFEAQTIDDRGGDRLRPGHRRRRWRRQARRAPGRQEAIRLVSEPDVEEARHRREPDAARQRLHRRPRHRRRRQGRNRGRRPVEPGRHGEFRLGPLSRARRKTARRNGRRSSCTTSRRSIACGGSSWPTNSSCSWSRRCTDAAIATAKATA